MNTTKRHAKGGAEFVKLQHFESAGGGAEEEKHDGNGVNEVNYEEDSDEEEYANVAAGSSGNSTTACYHKRLSTL